MKFILFSLLSLLSFNSFSQETVSIREEEFIPITIEEKEAFMSTKTGEFIFLKHDKTDATALKTTSSGVIYTDVKTHAVKKGETLSLIARKNGLSITELKTQNKLKSTGLSIGQKLKVVKKIAVKSSSPVVGTNGEETIVARLRPGQTPASLNAPSINLTNEKKIKEFVKVGSKASFNVAENKNKISRDKKPVVSKKEDIPTKRETVEEIAEASGSSSQKVKNGDSLQNILDEKKVKESVKVVENVNEISSDKKPEVGKKEVVPTKREAVEEIAEASGSSSHKVKKGDTLYNISKRYGMSVDELKKLNGLVSNVLSIGQTLEINQK